MSDPTPRTGSLIEWWESERRERSATEMLVIYHQAQQEAVEALARVVAAAGGEVRVPDRLLVEDVTMAVDYEKGETVYRAALRGESDG
jgi:hypothetical protein